MWNPFKKKQDGSQPMGMTSIQYHPDQTQYTKQDHWNYPWGSPAVQNGGYINTYQGNQLPGNTNFIPGVWQSKAAWMLQRNVQLQGNYVLNPGMNIQGITQNKSNDLLNAYNVQYYGYWNEGGDTQK